MYEEYRRVLDEDDAAVHMKTIELLDLGTEVVGVKIPVGKKKGENEK